MFWEKAEIDFQKNDDRELMSCNVEKRFSFLFSILLLSSMNSLTRHKIFCLMWFCNWFRIFHKWMILTNSQVCFSLTATSLKNSFAQMQFRNFQNKSTHSWLHWVQVIHWECENIVTQRIMFKKQCWQVNEMKSLWRWIFLARWLCCIKWLKKEVFNIMTMKIWDHTLLLIYDLETSSKKKKTHVMIKTFWFRNYACQT